MSAKFETVVETLDAIIARRPVLEPILRAFEPLLSARAELPEKLREAVKASGMALPAFQRERAAQGAALLAGEALTGIGPLIELAAKEILPLLEKHEFIVPHIPALRAFFIRENTAKDDAKPAAAPCESCACRMKLSEAIIAGDADSVERDAAKIGVPASVLIFAMGYILGAVLQAIVKNSPEHEPWNEEGVWKEGYCPVCGATPSIAILNRKDVNASEFLAGGGGKKYLHCSLCGSNWHFRRSACPSCGKDETGIMAVLREEGAASLGERVDWCSSCKSYCPTIDLRERASTPNLDAAAIGMMHLDMVAAEKKLSPITPAFWNVFEK